MLVLARRKGERILIAGEIEIVVVRIENNKVKLGITAPQDLEIVRTELLEPSEAVQGE